MSIRSTWMTFGARWTRAWAVDNLTTLGDVMMDAAVVQSMAQHAEIM
jgi:hypothetical protein